MKKYHQVIVVGGGWAGVSAAVAARKLGIDVAICERTDMLLGAGLVGGIMRNNGRFVAAEEAIAMGFGDLFALTDSIARHRNISFPGHNHANLYDVLVAEPLARSLLRERGVTVYFGKRITGLKAKDGTIAHVESEDGDRFSAHAFVDTTGSSGPPGMCLKFGNGCACCIQRCPSFGPRVSLTSLMGLPEYMSTRRKGTFGAMSGSCKIYKETLGSSIRGELDSSGVVVIPLPERLVNRKKLESKVCQQYALPEYAESIVLLDTGHAKLMAPYFPLEDLRSVPGLENARYADPLAGGKGNSVRLTAVSPRDDTMKVSGARNLFVGGERSGVCVGHTEAIVTGALAGRNAALLALGKGLTVIPPTLAIGDYVKQSGIGPDGKPSEDGAYGLSASYTFAGSVYFERMKSLGLYTPDPEEVKHRVRAAGMEGAFLQA
ncbi:MAG: FAD-dependent oxidoreductase [Candidatus Fermentithermobacillus carboniphilus]|uniref:FAD-dependent oxidoreductase n=1 Tax=Candidatus Fermentithermobacillus carboniphilus TaxID=3085328 RepID=A0AAT9LDU6_9FIRM|nr:MAG: FAD-dependent oxidoreductase [Candidatus Fermentithermobacillus carboniphilus]